ncbi:MAG: UDP-N-acetylmuramate dehydrogenase [Pseudomonadales bacterium]
MNLSALNTLAIECDALHFREVTTEQELCAALKYFAEIDHKPVVLGEGSNIVFHSAEVPACLKIALAGVTIVSEDRHSIVLDVGAGENWNSLVNHSVAAGYFGLENLALIPGTVGAAPVQNIGAYGVELSEFVQHVVFRVLESAERVTYDRAQCLFAYRDSVFKTTLRDATVIESVRFKLWKKPRVNAEYAALAEALEHIVKPTPLEVKDAVVRIREAKLPNPKVLPNAGSFFKNPIVSAEQLKDLRVRHSGIVFYPTTDPSQFKLAAAWLIDKAGWRGRNEGVLGMHSEQALVLVNRGGASGKQLLKFAEKVQLSVFDMFTVQLHFEPRIY